MITIPIDGAFFLLGAICASFAGVIVARLNSGQGFLGGRSQCDACGEPLGPYALVPILSYIAARGRAQCCGARISAWPPLSEALLGTLFVFAYQALGFSVALPFMLASLFFLLALVLYDLQHKILPTPLLAAFVPAATLTGLFASSGIAAFLSSLVIASVLGLSLFAIHVFSRGRAMGFADAPLTFGLSLLVGSAAFSGFVFSFWIGAVIGILVLARRPRGSRMGVEVPFAPFLAAGFLLAYLTQWNPFPVIAVLFGN